MADNIEPSALSNEQVDGLMHPFLSLLRSTKGRTTGDTFMFGLEIGLRIVAERPVSAKRLYAALDQWMNDHPAERAFKAQCITEILEEIDPWLKT